MNPTGPITEVTNQYDPVFVHSRREAVVIFCLWALCLCWAVPYCYIYGYHSDVDPENLSMVCGIPSWTFWGVAVPWVLASIFSIAFCLFFMVDDDLGSVATSDPTDEDDDVTSVADDTARQEDLQ